MFKSWLRNWLHYLRFLVVFFSLSRQVLEEHLGIGYDFTILSNSSFMIVKLFNFLHNLCS